MFRLPHHATTVQLPPIPELSKDPWKGKFRKKKTCKVGDVAYPNPARVTPSGIGQLRMWHQQAREQLEQLTDSGSLLTNAALGFAGGIAVAIVTWAASMVGYGALHDLHSMGVQAIAMIFALVVYLLVMGLLSRAKRIRGSREIPQLQRIVWSYERRLIELESQREAERLQTTTRRTSWRRRGH